MYHVCCQRVSRTRGSGSLRVALDESRSGECGSAVWSVASPWSRSAGPWPRPWPRSVVASPSDLPWTARRAAAAGAWQAYTGHVTAAESVTVSGERSTLSARRDRRGARRPGRSFSPFTERQRRTPGEPAPLSKFEQVSANNTQRRSPKSGSEEIEKSKCEVNCICDNICFLSLCWCISLS